MLGMEFRASCVNDFLATAAPQDDLRYPNVMLSSHARTSGVLLPWKVTNGFCQAVRLLSTNTAINRSLRKSRAREGASAPRFEAKRGRTLGRKSYEHGPDLQSKYQARSPKPSGKIDPESGDALSKFTFIKPARTESQDDYASKPGGREGGHTVRPQARIRRDLDRKSGSYKSDSRLQYQERPRRHREKTGQGHGGSLYDSNSMRPVRTESQYDYSSKPGGNRATRRAAIYANKFEASNPGDNRDLDQRLSVDRQKLMSTGDRRSREFQSTHEALDWEVDSTQPRQSYRKYVRPETLEQQKQHDSPLAIPYTTPASEFLYGTSVIKAALEAGKRKFYKLYMYDGDHREVRDQDAAVRRAALAKNLLVERVKGDWLRLMDKMSQGRPHNVCSNLDPPTDALVY